MELKLGKTPAKPDAVKLKLARFLVKREEPKVPAEFGHENLISDWGMLGNDAYGDCVWAGAAHETMIWNRVAGRVVHFTDKGVLGDYGAATGFNPKDPSTDQGTDMDAAAKYRRTLGLADSRRRRHRVGAYLAIDAGNAHQHLLAAYMFGAVGLGVRMPVTAMDQFNRGETWDVVRRAKVEGGHYVSLVAVRPSITKPGKQDLIVVTWGRLQRMTMDFFCKYNDESVVYLSEEMLKGGRSPEGFDLEAMQAQLNTLTR